MAAPVTVTITMNDGTTTVPLTIPAGLTATQFIKSLYLNGGTWDLATADLNAGATWWAFVYFRKIVTS